PRADDLGRPHFELRGPDPRQHAVPMKLGPPAQFEDRVRNPLGREVERRFASKRDRFLVRHVPPPGSARVPSDPRTVWRMPRVLAPVPPLLCRTARAWAPQGAVTPSDSPFSRGRIHFFPP